MITEECLKELYCAVSHEKHFITNPITLSNCGHSVCHKCLPKEATLIRCKICDVETKDDFNRIFISRGLTEGLKHLFGEICKVIEKETSMKLNHLENYIKSQTDMLEMRIKYLEEEIDIRVESLKIEIEKAGEHLKNDLRKNKEDILKSSLSSNEGDIKNYSLILEELQNNNKNKIELNNEDLEKFQNILNKLDNLIERNDVIKVVELAISNENIDEKLIGEIHLNYDQKNLSVEHLLKNGKRRIIDLDHKPDDMIFLPNNQILTVNNSNRNYVFLDENLKKLKEINRINGQGFTPLGITLNRDEKILYLSLLNNNKVLMTNLELNIIKSIGSPGSGDLQFNCPYDLCFKNNILYICDYDNQRIQVYTKNLEFIKLLKLEYKPWKIKASDSMICIVSDSDDNSGVYFYKISDLSLYRKFSENTFRISEINSKFYLLNCEYKTVTCYDENGNFSRKITLKGTFNHNGTSYLNDAWDGSFIFFNNKLLMNSQSKEKLIEFFSIKNV